MKEVVPGLRRVATDCWIGIERPNPLSPPKALGPPLETPGGASDGDNQ